MPSMRRSGDTGRPRWLAVTAAAALTVALAACGSAAGSGKASSTGKAGGTNVTMWLVTTGPSPANTVINQAVTSFEKSHPADTITIDYIENQSYKQKIQLAMGAGNAPTIFWTWGGGPLKQFIDAGDVASYAKATVGAGEVPVIKGATGLFAGQQLSSYDQTIYTSVQQAPSFQYSWDQAVRRRRRRRCWPGWPRSSS
jgi:hypothetical protein